MNSYEKKAKIASRAIASFRENRISFDRNHLVQFLIENKVPYPNLFITELIKVNIIKAAELFRGFYVFTNIEPVYYGRLIPLIETCAALQKKYNSTYNQKHNQETIPCETMDEPSDIDLAVKLLKESGYKIYKPVTNFEEI